MRPSLGELGLGLILGMGYCSAEPGPISPLLKDVDGISPSLSLDWTNLEKGKIDLGLPLLTIRGTKGFIACGYVNVETCNKTNEACAIVTGVKSHEEMLSAPIKLVSHRAKELGVKEGMTGKEALEKLR